MSKEPAPEENIEDQNHTEDVKSEASDIDPSHVRGLMYTLVTICVFCASILLGPDGQILPADGDLKLPIVNLTIKQGSFLYFGPIIIICVSMYTYLFLLKILLRVKAGRENSDQYIFTMKNPAAQIATYCIFFWLPAIILFAFAYKGLPRPESTNLLGLSLIFLISIVSIQLILRTNRLRTNRVNFLGVIALSFICAAIVLYGFVGDEKSLRIEDKGWLERVRMELHTIRSMDLENVELGKRDLRNIEIRNAEADTIKLNEADLRGAVIKDASLLEAMLVKADLREAKLNCSDFINANFEDADLRNAKLRLTNFKDARFRSAKLEGANFHGTAAELSCSKEGIYQTNLENANLEEANLSEANLSGVNLTRALLNGAILEDAVMIGTNIRSSYFMEKVIMKTKRRIKTNLTRADLRCSSLNKAKMKGAVLIKAELGGTNFSKADLTNVDLSGTFFNPLSCSESCKDAYINDAYIDIDKDKVKVKVCSGEDIRKAQENCECDRGESRKAKLVDTNLQFANLTRSSLIGADLTNADLRGANLHGADLSEATLIGTKLLLAKLTSIQGIDCDQLKTVKYWKASIRDDKLECKEKFLNFEEFASNSKEAVNITALKEFHSVLEKFARLARERPENWKDRIEHIKNYRKMENATLSGVNLGDLNLEGLYLNKVKLDNALLSGTILKDAKLKGADLSGSNLAKADLSDANLTGANLSGANLSGVRGLTCDQLKSADKWEQSYRDRDTLLKCKGEVPRGSYLKSNVFQ